MIPISPWLPFPPLTTLSWPGCVSPAVLGDIGGLLLPAELGAVLRYWLILLLPYGTKRQGVEMPQSLWVMYSVLWHSPDVSHNVQTRPCELCFVATAPYCIINHFMRKSSHSLKLASSIGRAAVGLSQHLTRLDQPSRASQGRAKKALWGSSSWKDGAGITQCLEIGSSEEYKLTQVPYSTFKYIKSACLWCKIK